MDYERFRGRVLPDSVAERLDNMCSMGQLNLEELDERAFDALKELNEDGAHVVLDQFANSDLSHVQNKSAFLCGIMKTHREKKQQTAATPAATSQAEPSTDGQGQGANEEKVRALLDRTGYSLDITMGQRKYGGPPPGWQGPPPPTGPSGCCQVFVGKIPRDMYEDELIPPFEKYGQIYDFRIMMDPHTGQNKGYGFCTYADRDSAQSACKGLDNTEIRKNRRLGVCISIANDRLFVGSIPKTKTKQDILEEFRTHTDNLKDVIVYVSTEDRYKNRGFAFLEYDTHKAAALARRRLMSGRVKVWGYIIPSVDWADPLEEPDSETMAKVRVLHVRNVSPNTNEETLMSTFSEYGEIERVKKVKTYAFIHYKEREDAMKAIEALNGKTLDGITIEVSLAKPQQQNRERRHGQSGFGALNAPGKQEGGGFGGLRGRGGRGGPMGGRGGFRGHGGRGGGYGGYNDGYGYGNDGGYGNGGGYGNYDNYGSGYDGYGGGYDNYGGGYDNYGGGYDNYGSNDGYNGGGYDNYGNNSGGGYGNSRGGGGGTPRGRGGPRGGGGPRGREGPGARGGPRGGPGGRGMPSRGAPGRGGPGMRGGRGGPPRGGRGGAVQGKRKFDGEGGGAGNVSYPEPKRRFNQPGSQPIAQQPLKLESAEQGYGDEGYDQSNQWYQDSSYQQWS